MKLLWLVVTTLGLLLVTRSDGTALHRFPRSVLTVEEVPYVWETAYFEQQIDHFGFAQNKTFQQRYLINAKSFKKGGPIFFYTGNEGDIELFANNTGFMWEIAPEFGALVVFAEHRYYGKSQPFGDGSYDTRQQLNYFTSEQALADFAALGLFLKTKYLAKKMIAFGGSYGGMLTAWFRMKYPHVVDGGIAASAPIFQGDTDCSAFSAVVTKDFDDVSSVCSAGIRRMFQRLPDIIKTMGNDSFAVRLKLCDVDMAKAFSDWLEGILGYMAMVDYPYPASFLEPLPAWPITVACTFFSEEAPSDTELLASMYKLSQFYQNYKHDEVCINTTSFTFKGLGNSGWSYQSCNEMVFPSCNKPETDFFPPSSWDLDAYIKSCERYYHIHPRSEWLATQYGSRKSMTSFSGHSNIAFSNGKLDPWSAGGVLESTNPSIVVIMIDEGAHHLDLRHSNPADPQSVIAARKKHRTLITSWISQE